jgi:hypothetical protein
MTHEQLAKELEEISRRVFQIMLEAEEKLDDLDVRLNSKPREEAIALADRVVKASRRLVHAASSLRVQLYTPTVRALAKKARLRIVRSNPENPST